MNTSIAGLINVIVIYATDYPAARSTHHNRLAAEYREVSEVRV